MSLKFYTNESKDEITAYCSRNGMTIGLVFYMSDATISGVVYSPGNTTRFERLYANSAHELFLKCQIKAVELGWVSGVMELEFPNDY